MNYMKHCELLRQTCPEPMKCSAGCQVVKRDAPELPIVMFDKPHQWLKDLACTAVNAVGIVTIVAIVGLMVGYFYARFV